VKREECQGPEVNQSNPFETEAARSLLDQLIEDSRLYRQGKDFFVVRLRNFAPFNAMLLQVQKPGLNYAASARDWRERFGRTIKPGARPLLILWPFGPVALVYDQMDTEGKPLPEGVSAFAARGAGDHLALEGFALMPAKKNVQWNKVDAGDLKAGSIEVVLRAKKISEPSSYRVDINENHDANVQFATVAHELAHLFLGHLGADKWLTVPLRPPIQQARRELEAESVAFIVCARNGVVSNSERYLSAYVDADTNVDQLDLYQIMRAAGQVEAVLGLTAHTKYDRPKKPSRGLAGEVDQ
jgi:hypothetical protein